jgi:ABC-2 type transport system permease protein
MSVLGIDPRRVETHRVYGPSALGGSLRRFVELTLMMARTEFKLRYFGSVLGYLWSLMRPLLYFGVIYLFFTVIIPIGKGIPHYPVYLLTGIVLWNYFIEATGQCVNSMVVRESLLRKIRFPRMVVPLSTSLTAAFNLGISLIVVVVFALANGVAPALSWLWMIPIIAGFIVLATGLGLWLSALYVRFRDIQPIWEVTAQVLFYASPIMYTASHYKQYEHIAMLNPIAVLLTQMGYAFIHPGIVPWTVNGHVVLVNGHPVPTVPMRSALDASGGPLHLAISMLLLFGAFAIGWLVFTREAPRISENL